MVEHVCQCAEAVVDSAPDDELRLAAADLDELQESRRFQVTRFDEGEKVGGDAEAVQHRELLRRDGGEEKAKHLVQVVDPVEAGSAGVELKCGFWLVPMIE